MLEVGERRLILSLNMASVMSAQGALASHKICGMQFLWQLFSVRSNEFCKAHHVTSAKRALLYLLLRLGLRNVSTRIFNKQDI